MGSGKSCKSLESQRYQNKQKADFSNQEIIPVIAEELNNVAVDLYMENDTKFAKQVYKNAFEAIMTWQNSERDQSLKRTRQQSDFLAVLAVAKNQLFNISCSKKRSKELGLDSYQWSDSESDNNLKYISEAIKINNRQGKPPLKNNIFLSTITFNIGLIYMQQRDNETAACCFEKVLQNYASNDLESCNPERKYEDMLRILAHISSLNNLACIKYKNWHFKEAQDTFHEAFQIGHAFFEKISRDSVKVHSQEFTHLGTICYNIAIAEIGLGGNKKSQMFFERSLILQKQALGDDHLDLAIIHHDIGLGYSKAQQWDNAVKGFCRSLHIIRRAYGSNHIFVAKSLFHLGKAQEMKGNFDAALSAYQEKYCIDLQLSGPYNLETITTMCEIAQVHEYKYDLNNAMMGYNDALTAANLMLSLQKHSIMIVILCRLSTLLLESGETSKAMNASRQALSLIEENELGSQSVDLVEIIQMKMVLSCPPPASAA